MKSQVNSTRFRTLRWPLTMVALSILALVGIAGLANAGLPASTTLRLTRDVCGVVQVVNFDGSKFCLLDDRTHDQFCSAVWQPASVARLQVGEHVSGAVGLLATGASSSEEIFVLTDPQPTP